MKQIQGILLSTIILAIFTRLPLWRHEAWWVRSLDFPRLQLFYVSLLLVLVETVLLDFSRVDAWLLFSSGVLCLIYHAWWIAPYTRLFKVEVAPADTLDSRRSRRITLPS